MTARTEIEHRYIKRRNSLNSPGVRDGCKNRCATTTGHHPEDPSESPPPNPFINPHSKRPKSISVCVGSVQMGNEVYRPPAQPRTLNDFQFVHPELLTIQNYELQTIRAPALSTSEVFNEPPPLYVYRVIPSKQRKVMEQPPNHIITYIKRKKHTIIAWTFGIVAITICIIVVTLQTRGDVH
ncbi:unnamed protein product [Caenorhabditis bovis]|uniref:Uncharacterized protein n=1 Tax=Caenorhabditis bovis TaxID=2654633 RepID=A0A8S1E6H1_9PELO|nr:unnamed protein product [Caenorhabditis bovis]